MIKNIGIVVALLVVVGAVVAVKRSARARDAASPPCSSCSLAETCPSASQPATGLPRLVDLGRGTCIPCKQMLPILAELKQEYQGRLRVDVIDLRDDPDAAGKYGVRVIPTQIFFDAGGQERFRHEGFIAKADILAKWKELGVDLTGSTSKPTDE